MPIEIAVFAGGEGTEFFISAARAYEKARPDISVDLYGDPRISDKVRVRILEGTYPEATNAELDYRQLIEQGQCLPLDQFLDGPNWEGDTTWRKSFLPGSLDLFTVNGHVYALPFSYFANVIWYNKTIFEQHGWTPPKTWDELLDLCAKIKSAGLAPFSFQGRYPYYAEPFYAAGLYHLGGGVDLVGQRALAPGSFDNPASVQAYAWLQQLSTQFFQPGAMGMSHTESQLQFFLGNTAMISCGAWLKSEMKGKIPDGFRLGCFNFPLPAQGSKGDPTALNVFSNFYFVFANSKHPREAVDFFRFMTSRQMAGTFSRMQDIPTAIRGANEGNLSHDLDDLVVLMDRARSSYGIDPGQRFPDVPEMQQPWDDELYKVLTAKVTPAQAARDMEATAGELRNRRLNPQIVQMRHTWEPAVLLTLLGAGMLYVLVLGVRNARATWKPRMSMRGFVLERSQRLNWRNAILFIGPAALIYTVFVVIPSLRAFVWSTHEWNGISPLRTMTSVGLLNFKRLLFESDGFWIALNNNLFLMLVVPAFVIPLALFLAACISRGVYGAQFLRVVFFFPNLLGSVAVTLLWMHLYNPQGGPVNAALAAVGFTSFKNFAWLAPNHLYWALVPMSVWAACGFNLVLFLAAMQNVPGELYEAAEIEGASHWRQFWTITLPMIWDVLSIAIVFMVIGGMKAFEVIWLLTNQRPTSDNHVIATRMVQVMFSEFRVGEATAMAVLLFLMVFLGSSATLRLMRREAIEI